ncbi:hypothetical protein, partial [Aeromonas caviae]|uniref:hypothetical protein n=1 Tax=Aeromonas caviae TaxID=648 RepID=UPI002B460E24
TAEQQNSRTAEQQNSRTAEQQNSRTEKRYRRGRCKTSPDPFPLPLGEGQAEENNTTSPEDARKQPGQQSVNSAALVSKSD